jgi:N-acetylneuraminic acid mutarotase
MMIQMLEKLNMLELLNKLPSPTEGMLNTPREDILIAGGNERRSSDPGTSTEIYSWEKNGWFEVSPMNDDHEGASSFIYKDQFFVVGGHSKAIETLNLDELPLKWTKFLGELSYKCYDHQTVVYQQSVIHIGGYNYSKGWSNVISELQLTSPCIMKELCQMPEQRQCHGAEVFDDKVMILGGYCPGIKITDSVLEFDPKRNECKEMPKLPSALRKMATVRWGDEVVVLGGLGKDDQILNDVFMYNSKTGKTTALPSMLEKRRNRCAVITGNTIVVMGGMNEKGQYLSSVECFTMGGSTWEYLPAMNKARSRAVAEVLPSTRKYV